MTAMTEVIERGIVEPVESVAAAVPTETSLIEVLEKVLEISQDVEETDGKETPEQGDRQQDGQTVCPPAAASSSPESKWAVGARCRAVWSEDGLVYLAKVVSVDGECCRVCFDGYGNEEDMELSALQSLDAALQAPDSQDWKPGSVCRAVYSGDGLVYPAVVLWVKGQRCCVRFDSYNNEEEQDVGTLLNTNELHGPNRATAKGSGWKSGATSSTSDWKRRRREESQGERGRERRSAWRDDLDNSGGVKERLGSQSRVKEADEKRRGNQQRDEAEKPTNHSFPFFPPFPPPPKSGLGDPTSCLTPPPPPVWMFGGKESVSSSSVDSTSNMLMLWYMCGFHTGSFMAQQQFKSASKD